MMDNRMSPTFLELLVTHLWLNQAYHDITFQLEANQLVEVNILVYIPSRKAKKLSSHSVGSHCDTVPTKERNANAHGK